MTRNLYVTNPMMSGQDVRDLQAKLESLGYPIDALDGEYGPVTAGAVRRFQHDHGLVTDGIVGPSTTDALAVVSAVRTRNKQATASGGLLIHGQIVPVPGVRVIGPHDAEWACLSPGDCRPRTMNCNGEIVQLKPQMWMLHKTLADDPEILVTGAGPPGGDRRTAENWAGSPRHSGAHLVTGHDGEVACLADLWLVEAYHATVSNQYSVGHETCELVGGRFYEAAANATVQVCLTGCEALGIQLQTPVAGHYKGHPWKRMLDGGRTCIGIFGHRDNTENRDEHDPGEILFTMLRAKGVESFDFDKEEDLQVWRDRQRALNRQGYNLLVDGVPGPLTTAALKSEGYRNGIYALGKA